MGEIHTDGLIFDMDGTIWDNTPLFAASWERACKDKGYDVHFTPEKLQQLFGKTMTDIADACIPDENPDRRYDTVKLCEEYEMQDLADSNQDTIYEGLEDTLKVLSQKTKLFIVSNCQQGYIESFIERSGYGKYFTDFICYGDNGYGKADNIRLIAQKHGLKNPVYIGDIQGDKNACDEAGIDFIWAAYGYGKTVDGYAAKVEDIKDLGGIIDGI